MIDRKRIEQFKKKTGAARRKLVKSATAAGAGLRGFFAKAAIGVKGKKTAIWSKRIGVWVFGTAAAFGTGAALVHLSHPERNSPSVVYNEAGAKIYVYPQEKKVIREMGGTYLMADFNRQYACEGVRTEFPAWAMSAENKSAYSVRECRTVMQLENPGGVGTRALRPEDIWKMRGYLDQTHLPPAP